MKAIYLAIMLAESGFNPRAYNKEGNAVGLFQLTPIGTIEAQRQCELPEPDLFNPETNIQYGMCLFDYYLETSRSTVEALILYHGGYKARERFRDGINFGPKTSNYVLRVLNFKERFENKEIDADVYCNKYPSLPKSICKTQDTSSR